MRVAVVHHPGRELSGAPLEIIFDEMKSAGLRPFGVPIKKVNERQRADIVFMYNLGYRVHYRRIDRMRAKVFNVPFSGYGKHRQYPFLKAGGVSVPKFCVVDHTSDPYDIINELGVPVITKPSVGTGGRGVRLHNSEEGLDKHLKTLKHCAVAQEYVPEAARGDIRALVIDGEVVASLWRTPAEGKITSNFHSGGLPSLHKITDEERSQALLAAKSIGLSVAGVDIVPTESGPKVFEANSLPDFMHIKEVAGVDPIPHLVKAIKRAAENS